MALEDIIKKIEDDAKKTVEEQIEETKLFINDMISERRIISDENHKDLIRKANVRYREKVEVGKKLALSECKRLVLSKKIDYINELIAKTRENILDDKQKYFRVLINICNKYAENGEGVIYLSKTDIERLPKEFEATINNKLSEGKSIKVSSTPVEIPNGFIIRYDNFEQNCVLDSIFEESREEIIDRLNELLFN